MESISPNLPTCPGATAERLATAARALLGRPATERSDALAFLIGWIERTAESRPEVAQEFAAAMEGALRH